MLLLISNDNAGDQKNMDDIMPVQVPRHIIHVNNPFKNLLLLVSQERGLLNILP
jgi:hypothetical protein